MTEKNGTFLKFISFAKLEDKKDDEECTIWGIATKQTPDLDDEVCSYDTAKPVYIAWSEKAAKRTKAAGQQLSLGNLRIQHSIEIAGKVTKLHFDDENKAIWLGGEPLNDEIHQQLKDGYFTGYSQGGSYAFRECMKCDTPLPLQQGNNFCPKCGKNVTVLYGLRSLSEVSIVDSPCSHIGFEHIKADGSRELVKFKKKESAMAKETKTKRVAGEDLKSEAFAYVGDPEKTETWKLPIKFSDEDKTKSHIRNALARFEQTKGIPADEKDKVKAKIEAAAKEHGIDVAEEQKKAAKITETAMAAVKARIDAKAEKRGLKKGLYEVARFAQMLECIGDLYISALWERDIEEDDSEVPEQLLEDLDGLIETFLAMAEEEAKELAARTVGKSQGEKTMTPEELAVIEKAAKVEKVKHLAKMAHHHEKMEKAETAKAEHHEAHAEMHKAMHEKMKGMEKADVGSGAHASHINEIIANDQEFHKAAGAHHEKMAKECTKCAKAHGAMAETMHGMADADDKEEHEKAVKALKAAEPALDAAELATAALADKNKVVKTHTIDSDVAAEAEKQRQSPEYKAGVSAVAKAMLDNELDALRAKTIIPDGVKLAAGVGEGTRAVPRTEEAFKLAEAKSGSAAFSTL